MLAYLTGFLLCTVAAGLHEVYQTTTVTPQYPQRGASGGGVCHDSYYQCDEYNPCYEKEICAQGCCVNATCPGPEYYCFANGEYQCYEDEFCGPQSGCCEKYTPGQKGGQAAYPTTEPPYAPHHQVYQTTEPPYVYNHNAYTTTVPPYQYQTTEPPYNPRQGGHPQAHHMGNRPSHQGHQGSAHGKGHGVGHPAGGAPSCDSYYHCSSIADCWEGETCFNGCCTQTV